MAILSDYTAGTASVSGTTVTGDGTGWLTAEFREGDIFIAEGWWAIVAEVVSNTQIELVGWAGPSLVASPYRLRYASDGSRASAQARQLIDALGGSGSLMAFAELMGLPDTVPVFNGPGSMRLVPLVDMVSGVNYNVQVDTLADRDAYDAREEGFSVLVSDIGDGRSALYTRVGTAGNWTDGAILTGPKGDPAVLHWFDEEWSVGQNYEVDDAVPHQGSTYRAHTAHTSSATNEPGVAPGWESYWTLLAAKGETGDMGGVTDFWHDRLISDTTAAEARQGLGATAVGDALFTSTTAAEARNAIGAGALSGFRNKIINGDFNIWQRSGGSSLVVGTTNTYYGPDRWIFRGSSATGGSIVISRANAQPGGWRGRSRLNMNRMNCTGEQYIMQRIEGLEQFSGKLVTVTIIINVDTPENIAFDINGVYGTGGSPSPTELFGTTGMIPVAAGANHKISRALQVPDLSGKSFGTNDNSRLELLIRFTGTDNKTIRVTSVSLVEGDATAEDDPFSPRHVQQELALCQRYYESSDNPGYRVLFANDVTSGNAYFCQRSFRVQKRVAPTMALTNFYNDGFPASVGTVGADVDGFTEFRIANVTGPGKQFQSSWTANAEL